MTIIGKIYVENWFNFAILSERGKPPIKGAHWVFAKGLRPRNFFKKTKAKTKAAFEARILDIESQPDYNQVIGELLYQDLQKGGTLVRGKKAFRKLFDND